MGTYQNSAVAKRPSKYKIKIKVDNRSEGNEILKSVNKDMIDFPNYVSNSHDNSVELLVDSYSMAVKAKEKLAKKFDGIDVSKPIHTDASLFSIVGVPYEISNSEAVDSLINDNPSLKFVRCPDDKLAVFVRDDPQSRLTVKEVVKCRLRNTYRVVASISSSLIALLKWKSGKINVERHICKLYKVVVSRHDKCFNCLSPGHTASSCVNEAACARCAGPHQTKNCDSPIKKFSRVRAGHPDINHCFYNCKI